MGTVVKSKVGYLDKITREVRSKSMRKEVMVFFQSVVGNKKLLSQFKYRQKNEICSSLPVFLSSKEEVDMDEPLSHSPKKQQGELFTIVGDTVVGEPCIFVEGMCLYLFYCLCYEMDISTDMSED